MLIEDFKKNINEPKIKEAFNFLTKNMKQSIFEILGYNFFKKYIIYKKNCDIFYVTQNNQGIFFVSYLPIEKQKKLYLPILINLIFHPAKIFKFLASRPFSKHFDYDSDCVQCLHFVCDIKAMIENDISVDVRNKFADNIHYNYLDRNNYKALVATVFNENHMARAYFTQNQGWKIYNKNKYCFNMLKEKESFKL